MYFRGHDVYFTTIFISDSFYSYVRFFIYFYVVSIMRSYSIVNGAYSYYACLSKSIHGTNVVSYKCLILKRLMRIHIKQLYVNYFI